MNQAKIIRSALKELEREASLVGLLRHYAKNEKGRLTAFGRGLIALAKAEGMRQAHVAEILGVSSGAVSQHYARLP